MEKNGDLVRIPDVEVVIQAAEDEVAVVAFYFPPTPHGQVEVVASIREAGDREHLVACLYQAIAAINNEDWFTLAGLGAGGSADSGSFPF